MSPMWSSEKSDTHKTNKSFSSSTSSASSFSSSQTSPFPSNPNPRRTMEEVWEDINVPCVHGEDPHITNINFHGVNLQDFLAQPFAKNPHQTSIFTPPAPTHSFNLNSCPDLDFEEASRAGSVPKATPYKGFGSSSPGKKRGAEPEESTGDRRYKRMIKNRESAARSRARKQAYRFELEGELAILKEENQRLKKQQQMLENIDMEARQAPPKNTLCRTSTAPF